MQPEGYHKKYNMHGHGQTFIPQHQALAGHPQQRPVHVGVSGLPSPGQVAVAPFGQAQLMGMPPPASQPFLFPGPMHNFVPAGQLPQIPGNVIMAEQPVLFCIPMIFNTREMQWSCQAGFYVHPNTSTFVAGYHIMHHGMPLPNGYGPNPNIAHSQPQTGSPSGSNYTDSSSSGSRDNLVGHEPHARSPGNHGAVPPVSGAMVNGGMMYGYPQHHMAHIGVQQQQNVGGAGFQQGVPASYAQGGRTVQAVQGAQPDNANSASRMQADGQSVVGPTERDERKPAEQGNRDIQDGSSTVQSRSSSLGSAFESEQHHDGDGDTADIGHKLEGNEGGDYSRSSSLEDEAELPVEGDDHTVEEVEAISSRGQSGLKSAVPEQAEPKSITSQVYQRSGHNSPAVDLMARSGSAVDGAQHDMNRDLSRTSSMSSQAKTFTAESNADVARGGDSPFVDQAHLSSHTPDQVTGKESEQVISPSALLQDGVPAVVADAPLPSTPKSWADMAARNLSKPAALPGNKNTARPMITPRSESASERKLLDKTVVVKQPEKPFVAPSRPGMTYGAGQYRPPNTGGAYVGNGASRSFYQRQPGQPRDYEFPRLSREEAEKFPEEQQIYMQNLPRQVSTTMIAETMRRFGEVEDVRLRYHYNTTDMRFCFVLFKSREPVEQLLNMQEIQLGDHTAKIQRKPPTNNTTTTTRYYHQQQPQQQQQEYKRE